MSLRSILIKGTSFGEFFFVTKKRWKHYVTEDEMRVMTCCFNDMRTKEETKK